MFFAKTLGQSQTTLPDSLQNISSKELFRIAIRPLNKTLLKRVIALAKKEDNQETLADAYYTYAYIHKDENKLHYADSVIALRKVLENYIYPSQAYYLKGNYLFEHHNYTRAMNNFILAYHSAEKFNNQDMLFRSNLALGLLKEEIGDYEGELYHSKQNLEYLESNKSPTASKDYLSTLFAVTAAYNRLKNVDSAMYYASSGINKALAFDRAREYNDFVMASAQTLLIKGEYEKSLDSLLKVKPYYVKHNDSTFMALTNFFMAKNYLKIGEEKKGIYLLKTIDSIYEKRKDVRVRIEETYRLLQDYYQKQNDLKNELIYNKKLLALHKSLSKNEIYLNKKILEDYKIPALVAKNKRIVNRLKRKNYWSNVKVYMLIALSLTTVILLFYMNARKKLFKRRFEQLMQHQETKINQNDIKLTPTKEKQTPKISIPEEVITDILRKLDEFEETRGYLDSRLSINKLAKIIGTNPNYLSKIINHIKEVSFIQYINNLRIETCVEQLKTDSIYSKFTIKAIAQEFGFNNTESFSKAFYTKTGIKPSFFLKNLQNKDIYKSAS